MLGGADDAIALVEAATGRRLTYAALREAVARDAADAIAIGGVRFLFARNDVATVVSLYGALDAGVPVALFDARLDDARAQALIDHYRPEAIVGRALAAASGGVAPHPSLACLLTTSGATGSPKLVRLSRAATISAARWRPATSATSTATATCGSPADRGASRRCSGCASTSTSSRRRSPRPRGPRAWSRSAPTIA